MTHYTSKLFLKSAENYLIMDKKYIISQKGEKMPNFGYKLYFQKLKVLNALADSNSWSALYKLDSLTPQLWQYSTK